MKLTKKLRLISSIISGLLLVISFPFTGSITPFLFVALIPLLLVENYISLQKYRSSKVFIHALITFFIFNIGTTWWIYNASVGGAILAISLNSIFMAVVFQLFHLSKKYIANKEGYIALIMFWVSFEYLHYHWELSWTWLSLGNFFSIRPSWIQWYSTFGVLGGSVWVLIVNLMGFRIVNNVYFKSENWKIQTPLVWSYGLLILLPLSISLYTYINYEEKNSPFEVVLVQPNIDPYNGKFDRSTASNQLRSISNLAKSKTSKNTKLIIAPETALPFSFDETFVEDQESIKYLRAHHQQSKDSPSWLIGASTFKYFDHKNSRASFKQNENLYSESYNTALSFDPNEKVQITHKSKLVPGVEIIPFSETFPWLEELSIKNGGTSGSLGIENKPRIIQVKDVKVAPSVCYESIYGGWVAKQCNQGAELICIITNDGWWGDTPGYKQHKSFAQLRAIENRRSVVRSANTGISCIINQKGDIIQATEYWEKDVISGTVNLNEELSNFTKFGNVLGRSFTFVSVLLLIYTFVKRFKHKYGIKK